jgi:hypothetical protein
LLDNIENELRKKYEVDEYFYPKVDMAVDFPKGLYSEIQKIAKLLKNNGFAVTTENIYTLMDFKRKLLEKYSNESERKKVLKNYTNLIKQKQPVGSVFGIEYYLVVGIIGVLVYVLGKFVGSFSEEAGKIAAQKLLNGEKTQKDIQEELKIDKDEYNIFSNQSILIINKNDANFALLTKNLQKSSKDNVTADKKRHSNKM